MGYRAAYESPPTSQTDRVHYTADAAGNPVVVKADATTIEIGSAGDTGTPVQTVGAATQTVFTFDTDTNDRVYLFDVIANALEEATGDSNQYKLLAQFYRNGSSVVSEKHSNFVVNDEDLAGATLSWNISAQQIQLQVTGVAAKTLEWDVLVFETHRP